MVSLQHHKISPGGYLPYLEIEVSYEEERERESEREGIG